MIVVNRINENTVKLCCSCSDEGSTYVVRYKEKNEENYSQTGNNSVIQINQGVSIEISKGTYHFQVESITPYGNHVSNTISARL